MLSDTGKPPTLAPLGVADHHLHPAWQLSGLPDRKQPLTHFDWRVQGDEAYLQVRTEASYGVLTHAWQGAPPTELAWRWQLVQPLTQADIATKAGDDAAIKLCVMFRQPLQDIPLLQRAALSLARTVTRQDLPSATLCYLWDSRYAAGSLQPNPYTARVRSIVLNGKESATGVWVAQQRHIADDFMRLFGSESSTLPPVMAIAIGADSDNTQGRSEARLSGLRSLP
ncbi:MAG: DUF3047 domain-containing protein [Rhodoferax sp.]|uniref:DUF3047 domain-containing protein n=1 Tax=Rhodoferax sp. TaxID=50421 RepID=UPI001B7B2223|nr:DUF3047 domain-containing protein [Rhodoferax sp.]MBP9684402.1 DUF3047 domain-containing protein [Rhodoferax sp.]MBP9906525.1 DUF3047 domain-containing protein [Rhodoferax sp.]